MKKLFLCLALLTALPSIAFADGNVDFNAVSNEMLGAYKMHKNGSTAMMNVENKCWNTVKSGDTDTAKWCFAYTFTGATIEAGYAQREGRQSSPDYNSDIFAARFDKNMYGKGFSKEQRDDVGAYVVNNLQSILMGLSNAGMN